MSCDNPINCYINHLREENKRLKKFIKEMSTRFYCIGAPLNDNILNFNAKQKKYLSDFATEMKIMATLNAEESE